MKPRSFALTALVIMLAGQIVTVEANGGTCLSYWEDDGPRHLLTYVGHEDVGYGAFCYRMEMILGNGVMGNYCVDVYERGDLEFSLHGSSYYGGRDCYSSGYVDAIPQWSNSCHLMPSDRFETRIQSVAMQFCSD